MSKKPRDERRMLVDCAADGFRILNEHLRNTSDDRFSSVPLVPERYDQASRLEKHLYSSNPDVFYSGLAVLYAASDERQVAEVIGGHDVKADLDRSVDYLEDALYQESAFDRELAATVSRHTRLGDEEIGKEFLSRFEVSMEKIETLPTDCSIYFAKINHGYWEYMRGAYDVDVSVHDQFRGIDVRSKIRRLRTSGVTQFWGRQIQRLLMQAPAAGKRVALSVSLTAGTEPPAVSIRKGLAPVTRGAAVGLLSFFETAVPEMSRYSLGDGGATRSLIFDKTLELFYKKYIADSEACLMVVPPHLKQVGLRHYKGRLYRFIVPPTRVNEAWKPVAAALLGYLRRLGAKHQTITVLGQGASIASLMALLFADIDPIPGVRLRYFDLGRVLDVAAPDFLKKQAWAMRNVDEYLAEGERVFLGNLEPDCALASPL